MVRNFSTPCHDLSQSLAIYVERTACSSDSSFSLRPAHKWGMSVDNRNRVQKGVFTGGQFAPEPKSESGVALGGTPAAIAEHQPATPEMVAYLKSVDFQGYYAETVVGHRCAADIATEVRNIHPTATAFHIEKEKYFFDDDEQDETPFMMGRVVLEDGSEVDFAGDTEDIYDSIESGYWGDETTYSCAGSAVGRDGIARININDAINIPEYLKNPMHVDPPEVPSEVDSPALQNAHTLAKLDYLERSDPYEGLGDLKADFEGKIELRREELNAAGVTF